MATVLDILGWSSSGLRSPDHAVSFERTSGGAVVPIALLQMPNGTAKTTTLELLRAALSGSAQRWLRDEVRRYRRDPEAESGAFQVILRYGGRRLTISMSFDFVDGVVRYQTTRPGGIQDGYSVPQELRGFFTSKFVNLFIFDGELANRLLRRHDTNAQDAINSLFHLSYFGYIARQVEDFWQSEASARTATEKKGFNRRRRTVETIRSRIEKLTSDRVLLLQRSDEIVRSLEAKRTEFDAALEAQDGIKGELDSVRHALEGARREIVAATKDTFDLMRNPHALLPAFATEMVALKRNLDRAKLPESTASEFFVELAQEDVCVCGRPLDDEARRVIRDCAARYLGTDEVSELNMLKRSISTAVGDGGSAYFEELSVAVETLLARSRAEAELQTDLARIESQGVRNAPELDAARQEIDRLESERAETESLLGRYEDPDESRGHEETYGIAVLRKRLAQAEVMLAEITETLVQKQKRDILVRALSMAERDARDGIGAEVCAQANARIEELMPYNRIRISAVDSCLVLEGQEGGSVGETLTVAYAFLSTLFNRSDHQLPFVVDSPAGPLDYGVRPRIAELIPRLGGQFIAFVISSERPGFVRAIEQSTDQPILHLTLFRKGNESIDALALQEPGAVESADAFVVSGQDFFHSFQSNPSE